MNISMSTKDRYFQASLHIAVIDEEIIVNAPVKRRLVYASFAGIPEAVRALSAGSVEGRDILLGKEVVTRFNGETYRMQIKPMGLGDVAHSVVFHSQATLEGIQDLANISEEDEVKSYLFSYDGNMKRSINEHFMKRFNLPKEWMDQYCYIFVQYISKLEIVRNPAFLQVHPDFKAVRVVISENQVTQEIQKLLSTGKLQIPKPEINIEGKFDPSMTMKEYLVANMDMLAAKLRVKKPMYIQGMPIHPAIGNMGRVPFPAQAYVIQGIINAFEEQSTITANGAMGTGKTTIAAAIINVMHTENSSRVIDVKKTFQPKKGTAVLIAAPSITLSKWKEKELGKMLPHAKTVILTKSNEALALLRKIKNGYKPQGLEIYLVSLDRAKLGYEPYFAGIWKPVKTGKKSEVRRHTWHCPDCYSPLWKKDEDGETYVHLEWEDVADGLPPTYYDIEQARLSHTLLPNGLPAGYKYTECNEHKALKSAYNLADRMACTSKLFRPALKSRGETTRQPRWNMSQTIKKMRGFFDLFICDEVHQARGEGSGRGDAFGQMALVAPKNLLLNQLIVVKIFL